MINYTYPLSINFCPPTVCLLPLQPIFLFLREQSRLGWGERICKFGLHFGLWVEVKAWLTVIAPFGGWVKCFLCMPTEFLALHQDVKHKLCNTAQRDGVAVCNIWQNFLSRNLTWKNMVFGNIVAGWTVLWLVCGGASSTNYRVPHSLLKIGCKVCKPLHVDRQTSISTHRVLVVPLMPSSNQWQLKITNVPWTMLKMWDQLKN